MAKAIALLSGGLDSILAVKIILEQGIEIEAVNFLTEFCTCTTGGKTCLASKSAADELGVRLKVFEVTKDFFDIIKNPKHGYGRNMNPCIDCRIFIFKKAAEYMRSTGAEFLISGEVLGERPMSQRRDAILTIERKAGLQGLILRPLSAKLFEPTIAEKQGLVDRGKLLAIQGRCRKPQIQLAKDFGINDYPCPAGGCLLTDKGFSGRLRDLIKYNPGFTVRDIKFLKAGRHFRLGPGTKLIVGRNEKENNTLLGLAKEEDLCISPCGVPGPIGIGRGFFNDDHLELAARILARYSDTAPRRQIEIEYFHIENKDRKRIKVMAIEEGFTALRI